MEVYLGIDGGGTQTRSLLVNADGEILGRGRSGPTNVQHRTESELAETLKEVSAQAFAGTGTKIELMAACYGLAGSSTKTAQRTVSAMVGTITPKPAYGFSLQTDAQVALTGAFTRNPGALLILGTGSVCLATDETGKIHQTGGWGSIIDDAGSSGWIGKRAIETAVRQADGRIEGNALQEAIFNALGIDSVDAIVPLLHGGDIDWKSIAALCPIVMNLAEGGDATANHILESALNEIVAMVRASQRKSGATSLKLAITGGLSDSNSFFYKHLHALLIKTVEGVQPQRPKLPAVAGAVLEAYRHHHNHIPASFIENLRASLNS
jgi:N-acetylglucosamine kinase-like BadF-type ATPase